MAEKRRVNLSLTLNSALHRQAWNIIKDFPVGQRTEEICQIICEWCKLKNRKTLLENFRSVIREELQNLQIGAVMDSPEKIKEPEPQSVSDDVLGFLRSLQDGDGIG